MTVIIYYRIQAYYRPSSREVGRLHSLASSPIMAHFTELLDGLDTVRAFSKQGMVIDENKALVSTRTQAWSTVKALDRW